MKEIRKTTQFKKDFKRIRNDEEKVIALLNIVKLLELGYPIPQENYPHRLVGDYSRYMECHIHDDYLLIWIDISTNIVKLVRLGTHSELFGKGRKR